MACYSVKHSEKFTVTLYALHTHVGFVLYTKSFPHSSLG